MTVIGESKQFRADAAGRAPARRRRVALRRVVASLFGLALVGVIAPNVVGGEEEAPQGDPVAGKDKAQLCAACHGFEGISSNPLWPNLAGQHEAYLDRQIRAFRDGERVDVSMQPFVANLTDQDIADLAAYYAGLPGCP